MKKILLLFLVSGALLAAATERIPLGSGQAALLDIPDSWVAGEMPGLPPGLPAIGSSRRYVTKSGSNDSLMITLVPLPDDRLADAAAFKEMVEDAAQRFVAGSVEGKVNLKELKVGRAAGFAVTFTDASLVGRPAVKDDYKSMTSCFVYLGNQLLLTATIFTDDVNGKACAEARHILNSLTLSLAKDTI